VSSLVHTTVRIWNESAYSRGWWVQTRVEHPMQTNSLRQTISSPLQFSPLRPTRIKCTLEHLPITPLHVHRQRQRMPATYIANSYNLPTITHRYRGWVSVPMMWGWRIRLRWASTVILRDILWDNSLVRKLAGRDMLQVKRNTGSPKERLIYRQLET